MTSSPSSLENHTPLAESPQSSKWWPTVCACVLCTSLMVALILLDVLVPLTPQLKDLFHINVALVGLLFSMNALVAIAVAPITAEVVNATDPRLIICGGLVMEVISTIVFAVCGDSYAAALIARAIQGLGSSGINIGAQCFIASVASGDEGALYSVLGLGIGFGAMVAPSVGGALAAPTACGFHGMFWVFTGVSAFVLLLHVLVLYVALPADLVEQLRNELPVAQTPVATDYGALDHQPVETVGRTEMMGIGEIFSMLTPWRILIGIFTHTSTVSMLAPVAAQWAVHELGIASDASGTLGLMWFAAPIGMFIFTPVAGMLADMTFRKNLLMGFGLVLMIVGLLLLGATSVSFGRVPLFEVSVALVGIGAAFEESPAQAALAAAVGKAGQGAAFAAFDMFLHLGFIVGPLVGCAFGLNSHGAGILFIVFAVILGLTCILTVVKKFEEVEEC